MVYHPASFEINELWLALVPVIESLRANPGQTLIVLAGTLITGYLITIAFTPSSYKNIAGPPTSSFLYGHLESLYCPEGLSFHDSLQDTYGSVSLVKGLMGSEQLYISDPRAVHEIVVKETDSVFRHPQFNYDLLNICFGPGLGGVSGAMHKAQRKMLNPVFTTKHMIALVNTAVFHILLKDAMEKELRDSASKDLDMLYWCSATALELIGQAGIGHKFGVFQGVESAYSHAIKGFLPTVFALAPYRIVLPWVYNIRPASLRRKMVEWAPSKRIQRLKEIIDVQDLQAHTILNKKRRDLREGGNEEEMNDIISILLKANMEAAGSDRLPEDQLLGQMNSLIFAGHETTSGALARVLHLLALNQDIQDRLRTELQAAPTSLNYNELNSLQYLDAVCREVLRLYAPLPVMERQALKDWVVPLRYPVKGKDGTELREIIVTKGTHIYVALREANRCRETWGQDADTFRPERWLEDLPSSVAESKTSGVFSSTMTFSAGPRACIGFKFAVLEIKTVLSVLIRSFKFAPSATPVEWRLGLTMNPFQMGVEFGNNHPAMPLIVSVV
ncbi:cytochrome P450 [Ceratobasidium sp. AG-I]|nr:cytochrome P450 [Ceratobasidium sp. AG-I]